MNGVVRDGDKFVLSVDTRVYSLEAVKKTAYKFAAATSIILQPRKDEIVRVLFNFAGVHGRSDPEGVISDFCNELLDQDLREIIKRETAPIRNLILAHAFSRSSLVENNEV
ncbi:MAG TPA: His-Xaa-Ser system protein HxsD [Bryobacteraceae bacterium]|nr:His-Xaa-Ser system protein HxsD [Bryobacteraceae bacterium]